MSYVGVKAFKGLTAPEEPETGWMWFDESINSYKFWNGSKWALVQTTTLSGSSSISVIEGVVQVAVGGIVAEHLGAESVTTGALKAGSVDAEKIKAGSIESGNIKAEAITTGLLAANAVTAGKVNAEAIETTHLKAEAVDATKIKALAIEAGQIKAEAITSGKLAAESVEAGKIKAEAITTIKLAAESVDATKIKAGSIEAGHIKANTITAGQIAAGTITSVEIASGTITGSNIAGATITASKITISELSALSANLGSITAGTITGGTVRTAASGKRAIFDSSGIRLYDAGEAVVFNADSTTGNLTLKGTIQTGSTVPATVITGQLENSQIKEIEAAKVAGQIVSSQLDEALSWGNLSQFKHDFSDVSRWVKQSGSGTLTSKSAADAGSGAFVGEVVGEAYLEWPENIPFDPKVLYRVSVRVRQTKNPTSGGKRITAGVVGIASDGTTRVNSTGANLLSSQHFIAASHEGLDEVAEGTTWTTYTGYFKGTSSTGSSTKKVDPTAPGVLHENVRYFRPMFRFNTNTGDGTAQIDSITVQVMEFPDEVISTERLKALAVTASKLAAESVEAGKIKAGAVETSKLAAGSITSEKIATGEVKATNIATDAIESKHIKAGSIEAVDIKGETITAEQIATGTIAAKQIAALTITGEKIAATTITGGKLVAETIEAGQIKAGAITAGKIAAEAVEASKIKAEAVTAEKLSATAIDAMTITGATIRTSAEEDTVLNSEGFRIRAGTTSSPATTRKIRYVRASGGAVMAEQYGYNSGATSFLITTLKSTSPETVASMKHIVFSPSGTGSAELQLDAADASQYLIFNAGALSKMIMNSASQSDFLQLPSTTNIRMVHGVVNSAGAKVSGDGFTVTRPETGLYTITYSTKFSTAPLIIAMDAQNTQRTASGSSTAEKGTVVMSNGTGAKENIGFSFVAIGLG